MQLAEFDFALPPEQIAQHPLDRRDASRLMLLSRSSGAIEHRSFSQLAGLLRKGDVLVVNDARVVPARLLGQKTATGGRAELLVVRPVLALGTEQALNEPAQAMEWICLGQASKGLREGTELSFTSQLRARVTAALGEGEYRVRFEAEDDLALGRALELAGQLPLPPYVERIPSSDDRERYQTVYARAGGSVAAPTAGLHFTQELLSALEQAGVIRVPLTLDVGPGTFLPVRTERAEDHRMHLERYHVPLHTAAAVNAARAEGRRVVAVGTTVVRTLEAATEPSGTLRPGAGETQLFITPGYRFRQVDALITNFHLPRSTLLMLVSAFAGIEGVRAGYAQAIAGGYRFFSYGDAMWIAD